jgi:hypothetical protein
VVQHILSYLDLDDILPLTGVCVYFNCLIKSTFFIKYIVAVKEKSKIDISLDAFSSASNVSDIMKSKMGGSKKVKKDTSSGDAQA